jgi:hypothetical protein
VPKEEKTSDGGSRIYRYRHPPKEGPIVGGEPANIEAISAHIERHVGPIDTVFHEIVSPTIHVDVHHVPPDAQRAFHVLVTSGMSDLPMTVPEGLGDLAFAEVVALLPREWPLTQEAFNDERNYWPVRTLKFLARFPHEYGSWLGLDHTIPNGDPPAPYADNTAFCGVILTVPISLPREFFALELKDGRKIQFLAIAPLLEEEMELKLSKGTDALFDRFDKCGISDVIDVGRQSACRKRRWWFS